MGFKPSIGQVGLEIPVLVATLVTLLPLPKGQQGQQHSPVLAAWPGSVGLLLWRWHCAGKVLPESTEAGHDGSQRTQQTQTTLSLSPPLLPAPPQEEKVQLVVFHGIKPCPV